MYGVQERRESQRTNIYSLIYTLSLTHYAVLSVTRVVSIRMESGILAVMKFNVIFVVTAVTVFLLEIMLLRIVRQVTVTKYAP